MCYSRNTCLFFSLVPLPVSDVRTAREMPCAWSPHTCLRLCALWLHSWPNVLSSEPHFPRLTRTHAYAHTFAAVETSEEAAVEARPPEDLTRSLDSFLDPLTGRCVTVHDALRTNKSRMLCDNSIGACTEKDAGLMTYVQGRVTKAEGLVTEAYGLASYFL
jgi:hypothetical protein